MSDALGAAWLPALVPSTTVQGNTRIITTRAPGDPALVTLGSFLATVMQDQLNAAWAVLDTASTPTRPDTVDGTRDGVGVVRGVHYHDPSEGAFLAANLPALFVYRHTKQPARYQRVAADAHRRIQPIVVTWVTAPVEVERQATRQPFANAVNAVLHHALTWKRHPSWVTPADERDLDALKTSFATSTGAVTISTFNGVMAGQTMAPPRPICFTATAAVGAYSTNPIVVTGVDKNGTFQDTASFATANGGATVTTIFPFASPTSIALPAMLLTSGSLQIGYWDSPEKRGGSLVQRACGFSDMRLREIRFQPFNIARERGAEPVRLLGVEAVIDVSEDSYWDPDVHAQTPYTTEAHVQQPDGTDFSSLET